MTQLNNTSNPKLPVTARDVSRAATAISGTVVRTDFCHSRTLSKMFGAEIWLKFENLQFTASFKERGALNKLLSLSPAERAAGVIAMSAGNHGQGVAYHARRLGIAATIVMPETTPIVKIENTRQHGATVIVKGSSIEEAHAHAEAEAANKGLTFLHPYDDPHVIAGQGTIAEEMLADTPTLDTLIVPIGGGGLISGMGIAAKAIKPDVEVVGVQSALFPAMYNAINNTTLPIGGDTLAEGIAVAKLGELTERILRVVVDDVVLVDEAALEHAVLLFLEIEKTVVEGAGAAGLAAMVANPERFRGKTIGMVLCGGNIDTRLLASVLTRGLARAGRLSELSIDLPDRPGQLAKLAKVIGDAGANIVETAHLRIFTDLPAKSTRTRIVLETRDATHLARTIADLQNAGFTVDERRSTATPAP